jgi:hypothetical protein
MSASHADWFLGISRLFLAAPVAKMLMLAGTDRLDRDLTIGQMQGVDWWAELQP